MSDHCSATRKDGAPCGLYPRHGRDLCINHDPEYAEQHRANAAAGRRVRSGPNPAEIPEAIASRDARKAIWWLTEQLATDAISTNRALALARVLRIASQMGPDDYDEDRALREVELRAWLMHGIPPRDEEEWELAKSIFEPEAIAEFKRWELEMDELND